MRKMGELLAENSEAKRNKYSMTQMAMRDLQEEKDHCGEAQVIPVILEEEWSNKQWDAVQQVQSRILHFEQKFLEHLKDSKKNEF